MNEKVFFVTFVTGNTHRNRKKVLLCVLICSTVLIMEVFVKQTIQFYLNFMILSLLPKLAIYVGENR